MDNLSFQNIYSHLLEGNRLTLSFPSPTAAESFRVKMAKYKTAQEELCAIVDMKVGSEDKSFCFSPPRFGKYFEGSGTTVVIREVSFSERPRETKYEVIEIEATVETFAEV